CDCVKDTASGHAWTADGAIGAFVDSAGQRLPQGWKVNVGLSNFGRVLTDPRIAGPFFGALLWNFAFAIGSVLATFALGLFCALAMHSDRVRGRALYRILLVLP